MLPNIQILRAVAAYLVLFVHLRPLLPESSIATVLHDKGYSGVDLFFVISGFIMVYTTSRRKVSASEFLLNRVKRIVPLYYLTTFFVFVIAISLPFLLHSSSPDIDALLKSLVFIPFEKSPGRIYPVYYLGWTLNYEMFFYLIFALSLSIRYEMRVALCATMILGLVLFGLYIRSPSNVILHFYSQTIMLDFSLGMILALFRDQISATMHRIPVLPWLTLSLGLGLLVAFSFLPITSSVYAPPTNTLLTFGVPAALIVMAAVGFDDVKTRGQPWQFLQEIGNASYSIYLTHFFVVGVLNAFANYAHFSPTLRILVALIAIPLTAIVGIGVYRFFERPVMSILERRKPADNARAQHVRWKDRANGPPGDLKQS
ncbi:acyltransferase family protein [Bradyrhizobium australiense]|uniref:Acyltransferase n=1 Tax=Bradyrhizobium australiense TaxID=2721161 RepID=A0A7Y4LYK1_9BRAD|nr:acyltransferase [Bradyrhizobium australiense]NOJ43682.1 acyltransferase [Bradyrhizobium australiense]